jgi:hypothetical protein
VQTATDATAVHAVDRRGVDAEQLAWLLAIVCALSLVAAIVLLGPLVGEALYPPLDPTRVWAFKRQAIVPESREQAGYLLAVLAAAGLAGAIVPLARRTAIHAPAWGPRLARAAQAALAGLLIACVIAQYRLHYVSGTVLVSARYFTIGTWIAASAAALAVTLAIRSDAVRERLRGVLRERTGGRWAALLLAVVLTAGAMTACIDSDATIAGHVGVATIVPYVMDEAFAVVDGLTPFVDFQPLYAALWPYVTAIPLTYVAPTLLVLTLTLYALSVAALLGIFGVLRRATGSAPAALLLYVPFLATSLFLIEGSSLRDAYSAGNYFPAFPLRYGGPYLLAWLTVRSCDRTGGHSHWLLFCAAGLVALNNANFGVPAAAATVVAVLIADGAPDRVRALAVARDVALGTGAAVAALCLLTLARSGELPDLAQPFAYARFFVGGYSGTRIPAVLGVHVIVYVTFAGALATAAVRAVGGAAGRALTAMLAWSGVFGLGAGSYFVAESGPFQLRIVFSAWALTLALLAAHVVRRLLAAPRRRPSIAEAAVLVGLGLTICSIPQLPRPWTQAERLRTSADAHVRPLVPDPALRGYLASVARGRHELVLQRGAPVALLVDGGHRMADAFGVVNVNRYTAVETVLGPAFLARVAADLRRAGGNTLVLPADTPAAEQMSAQLRRLGFAPLTARGVAGGGEPLVTVVGGRPTVKWVDMRHLRPAALAHARGAPALRYRAGR